MQISYVIYHHELQHLFSEKTRKRAKTSSQPVVPLPADFDDEFEITPPPSPTIMDEISEIKHKNKMAAKSRAITKTGSQANHPDRLIESEHC